MRDERGQRPQVKHTFRRWIKTMADDRDQPRMMMANTFYNYFHFHLNPVIPCVDWLTLPSTTYTQRTTRFVQKGKRQNSKKKNRLRQEIMSRQVALGQSQNNRRLQGECQTEDCARQCFQDDWQAPTVFSRLCFREPEAGARKARIFLSWHPTKRQVDGGRDECTSSPVVRRRKPKREDGGGGSGRKGACVSNDVNGVTSVTVSAAAFIDWLCSPFPSTVAVFIHPFPSIL